MLCAIGIVNEAVTLNGSGVLPFARLLQSKIVSTLAKDAAALMI